eukprot:8768324-Pyramimonas_sp.AAC.2
MAGLETRTTTKPTARSTTRTRTRTTTATTTAQRPHTKLSRNLLSASGRRARNCHETSLPPPGRLEALG